MYLSAIRPYSCCSYIWRYTPAPLPLTHRRSSCTFTSNKLLWWIIVAKTTSSWHLTALLDRPESLISYCKIISANEQVKLTLPYIMASSNGNIFRVTGPLCGEFTGHGWIPCTQGQWRRALMLSLICAGKRLSKHSWGWWFETPLRSSWRHCNA